MNGHDVKYFRHLLRDKTQQFKQLCLRWESFAKSSESIPEEIEGEIRLTVGKAQLLTDQRFRQFSGLIDNCEFELGEKETTCDDLQGFWDMIYIQVVDIQKKFDHLQKLENNNWENNLNTNQCTTEKVNRQTQINPAAKPKVNSASIRNHILAARKNLAEAKARAANGINLVENGNVKVFEAPRFFVINSPVRKPNMSKEKIGESPKVPSTPSRKETIQVKQKTPLAKNYLSLSVVTRSAKRALLAKEAMEKNTSNSIQ